MKTFEREEHDAAFYMRSVRLNRKVQSSSSHGVSQIHLTAWNTLKEICIWFIWLCKRLWWFHITSKSMADKKFGDCRNKIGARSGDCRNKTEETIQASHPRHCHLFKSSFMILWRHMKEKNMMQSFTWGMSDSTGRYNHQAHNVMVFHKFTWCMKHLGAHVHLIHLTQYNRLLIPYHLKVNVRQKVQSSSSHGVSQIHLLHETPWRKYAIDSFDSVQDFGDSILHQSQWQTKNLVIAETRLEQDQVIAGTRPKKQCKHHTQDIVTYSRAVSWYCEDTWKRKHCIRDFCVQIISIDNNHSGKLANSDLKWHACSQKSRIQR